MMAYLKCLLPANLSRYPEVLLTIGLGGILGTLIVPFPPIILDILLATNIILSVLILVAVVLSEKPLAISSFPTLLLITTLFRLGLNVSSTRMILSTGKAGDVVTAFGQFVAQGDVPMGVVVFIILTLVQLMVIGKGAERVAEVGARFTLDAMPGKQMSIDAALRGGSIDDEEADRRRHELGRESQFYGAMDGAMKFVKGDATVGIIVTFINLIAGLAIGIVRFNMSVNQAAETFAILTIGDGLVSQIPSLLIALSAGILTTRVASKSPKSDLGKTLSDELLGSSKTLALAGLFAFVIGLVPGLPILPFFTIAAILLGTAYINSRKDLFTQPGARGTRETATFEDKLEQRKKLVKAQKSAADALAPTVPLVGIDLENRLSDHLGFGQGHDDATELMAEWMSQVRDAVFSEHGLRLPGVRVRSHVPGLGPRQAVFKIKDVPVAVETIAMDKQMALATPEHLKRFGVEGQLCKNPLTGAPAALISPELSPAVSKVGIQVLTPSGVVALHLFRVTRGHLPELLGLQETAESLKRLEKVCADLVSELVPRVVTVAQLRDVLRQLLREKVSIRDLKSILEGLGELADKSADIITLTEHVRGSLALQLTHQLAGPTLRLGVVVLDADIEDAIRNAIVETPHSTYLALEPELRMSITEAVKRTFEPIHKAGVKAAVITQSDIRFFVRSLLDGLLDNIPVVSYQELRSELVLQPLGQVRVQRSTPQLAAV